MNNYNNKSQFDSNLDIGRFFSSPARGFHPQTRNVDAVGLGTASN